MNLEELKEHIKFEEGVKLNDKGEHILYNDSLGYKTLGIGHLVRASDPENNMEEEQLYLKKELMNVLKLIYMLL